MPGRAEAVEVLDVLPVLVGARGPGDGVTRRADGLDITARNDFKDLLACNRGVEAGERPAAVARRHRREIARTERGVAVLVDEDGNAAQARVDRKSVV